MRILLTAAVAASLAAGSLSALAQTPAPTPKCKTLKGEDACKARTDCTWSKPKCKTAPKQPKTT